MKRTERERERIEFVPDLITFMSFILNFVSFDDTHKNHIEIVDTDGQRELIKIS